MRRVDLNSLNSEPLSHDTSSSKQVFIRNGTIPHLTQLAQARIPPGTCIQIAPSEVHAFENHGDEELVLVYFGVDE